MRRPFLPFGPTLFLSMYVLSHLSNFLHLSGCQTSSNVFLSNGCTAWHAILGWKEGWAGPRIPNASCNLKPSWVQSVFFSPCHGDKIRGSCYSIIFAFCGFNRNTWAVTRLEKRHCVVKSLVLQHGIIRGCSLCIRFTLWILSWRFESFVFTYFQLNWIVYFIFHTTRDIDRGDREAKEPWSIVGLQFQFRGAKRIKVVVEACSKFHKVVVRGIPSVLITAIRTSSARALHGDIYVVMEDTKTSSLLTPLVDIKNRDTLQVSVFYHIITYSQDFANFRSHHQ